MTRFAVTTRVESSKVLGCLLGRFHAADEATVLWGYNNRLELYRERPTSVLELLCKQQVHDILLALAYLRGQMSQVGKCCQAMSLPHVCSHDAMSRKLLSMQKAFGQTWQRCDVWLVCSGWTVQYYCLHRSALPFSTSPQTRRGGCNADHKHYYSHELSHPQYVPGVDRHAR